jgi:hypothetical protein
VLKIWRDYGAEVSGGPIACGHYVRRKCDKFKKRERFLIQLRRKAF